MQTNEITEVNGVILTTKCLNQIKDYQDCNNDLLTTYIDVLQRAALSFMRKIDISQPQAIEEAEHVQNISFVAESLRNLKKP